jgi:antiviral helicase SLH1
MMGKSHLFSVLNLGRAGRPGFDTSGVARIFTSDSKKSFYKHFLHTGMPVESALHKVLDDHICAEISAETIKSKQQVMDYLAWTFLYRRLHRNPSYYGLEDGSQSSIDAYLSGVVSQSLDELQLSRCIEVQKNKLLPTALGKISSYYYLSHKTIRNFCVKIKSSSDLHMLLRLLAEATEYDELPVRHNEDKINYDLSMLTRYKIDDWQTHLGDAHVKAFILVQAHLSHLKMPISDYVNDTITVLDSSIRIMQVSRSFGLC